MPREDQVALSQWRRMLGALMVRLRTAYGKALDQGHKMLKALMAKVQSAYGEARMQLIRVLFKLVCDLHARAAPNRMMTGYNIQLGYVPLVIITGKDQSQLQLVPTSSMRSGGKPNGNEGKKPQQQSQVKS